jgi:hypothetical protein
MHALSTGFTIRAGALPVFTFDGPCVGIEGDPYDCLVEHKHCWEQK